MLLPEIYSNIILQAGGIKLLRSISSSLIKLNYKIIEEYDMIRKPITPEEIEQYLVEKPEYICTFRLNKLCEMKYNTIKTKLYEHKPTNKCNYRIKRIVEVEPRYYRNHQSCEKKDQCNSDIELITNNKLYNYDLATTFTIINRRSKNNYLAYKVCFDSFNDYVGKCKDNEILLIYLYFNTVTLGIHDVNQTFDRHLIEQIDIFKQKIIKKLKELIDDDVEDYYRYTNYIMQ